MNFKSFILAVLDCRPIKKVTRYATGTGLAGIGLGIIISQRLAHLGMTQYLIAGACVIAGSVIANIYYYALKYRYQIVDTQLYSIVEKGSGNKVETDEIPFSHVDPYD